MRIDLEARSAPSPLLEILSPFAALLAAIVIGGLGVAFIGKSPIEALFVYFLEPLGDPWALTELAVKAAPLVLIAIGLSFCYRANLWNIGAGGQLVMGGLVGGIIAVVTHDGVGQGTIGSWWVLPAMLVAGTLAGLLYAMIPAYLKVKLGASEILTSLMLVYIAELILDYLVRGTLRDPNGFNFPQS